MSNIKFLKYAQKSQALKKKHLVMQCYCFYSSQVETADETKTVLTCPRAVGPVQIVTHGSLAKVLLASTSIEGVYYYADAQVHTHFVS